MAYYRLSQVLKMRREAMGQTRFDYDVEGPSFMTVFRLEKGEVRVKEKTYRSLSRAMGEEESTRRGVLQTTDIRVLRMVNEITNAISDKNTVYGLKTDFALAHSETEKKRMCS